MMSWVKGWKLLCVAFLFGQLSVVLSYLIFSGTRYHFYNMVPSRIDPEKFAAMSGEKLGGFTFSHLDAPHVQASVGHLKTNLNQLLNDTSCAFPKPFAVFLVEITSVEQTRAALSTWLNQLQHPNPTVALMLFGEETMIQRLKFPDSSRVLLLSVDPTVSSFQKVAAAFLHALHAYPKATYFVRFHDHNYIYTRNFINLLQLPNSDTTLISSESLHYGGDPARHYPLPVSSGTIGTATSAFEKPRKYIYASASAGYILSRTALHGIEKELESNGCTLPADDVSKFSNEDDVRIGYCMSKLNIPLRDFVGLHPDRPEQILRWEKQGHPPRHVRAETESSFLKPLGYANVIPEKMRRMHDGINDFFAPERRTRMIPFNIHQIWLGNQSLAPDFMDSCKKMNPDFDYFLWTEDSMAGHAPEGLIHHDHFKNSEKQRHMQADLLRLEALLLYGGIYMDADSVCLRPLRPLFEQIFTNSTTNVKDTFAVYESEHLRANIQGYMLVANGIIGSYPYSPTMMVLIRNLSQMDHTKLAWMTTGPLYFTKQIHTHNLAVHVLPSHLFYPFHFADPLPRNATELASMLEEKGSYTHQLWGTTVNGYLKR